MGLLKICQKLTGSHRVKNNYISHSLLFVKIYQSQCCKFENIQFWQETVCEIVPSSFLNRSMEWFSYQLFCKYVQGGGGGIHLFESLYKSSSSHTQSSDGEQKSFCSLNQPYYYSILRSDYIDSLSLYFVSKSSRSKDFKQQTLRLFRRESFLSFTFIIWKGRSEKKNDDSVKEAPAYCRSFLDSLPF